MQTATRKPTPPFQKNSKFSWLSPVLHSCFCHTFPTLLSHAAFFGTVFSQQPCFILQESIGFFYWTRRRIIKTEKESPLLGYSPSFLLAFC